MEPAGTIRVFQPHVDWWTESGGGRHVIVTGDREQLIMAGTALGHPVQEDE